MQQQQLTLNVSLQDDYQFSSYYLAQNEQLVLTLQALASADSGGLVYLWGGAGSGKSHLLQASYSLLAEQQKSIYYLPMAELLTLPISCIDGFDQAEVVCIDDVHLLATSREWQEAIFHLFNRVHDAGKTLILSSKVPPRQLELSLADMQSRFSLCEVYQLQSLSDEERMAALQYRANGRGMFVGDEVASYIALRASRDAAAFFSILDVLAGETLVQQRRITVPFVKEVMGW